MSDHLREGTIMSVSSPPTDLGLDHEPYGGLGPPPEEMRNGIHYPSTDGEEMGENDWHYEALAALHSMLKGRYRGLDVYIAADMMMYYEEGNPRAVRAPDLMVVFGVKDRHRRSWLAWEEGALPAVVVEFASPKTVKEDLGAKKDVYQQLGIPEYILFDPEGDQLGPPRLRGYRLREGEYEPIDPDGEDGLVSEQLGLLLYPFGHVLRLVDLATRRALLSYEELLRLSRDEDRRFSGLKRSLKASRRRARTALVAERAKADVALATERAKADAERAKADAERAKADAERAKADAERSNAGAERARADAAMAELARLRALIGEGGPGA